MKKISELNGDYRYIGAILGLTLLFFWKVILNPGKMLWSRWSDIVILHSHFRYLITSSLKTFGKFPLWNPYHFAGAPFITNMQAMIFYPFTLPLIFFPNQGFGLLVMSGVFLAGLFTYLFAREIGLQRISSTVAAVVFAFSGPMIARIAPGHIIFISSLAWVPAIFWGYERLLKNRSLFNAVLFGIFLAIQILAGYPAIPFYTAIALFLYFVFTNFQTWKKDRKAVFATVKYILLGVIVALALSAVYLLPAAEFMQHSTRAGGTSYEFASSLSIPPLSLATIALPEVFGSFVDGTCFIADMCRRDLYLGILPLVLGILGFSCSKDRKRWFFAGLMAFALLFSLGNYTPVFKILYFIPGFSIFRGPSRILFLYSFSLAILAAFGTEYLISEKKSGEKIKKNLSKIVFAGLVLVFISTMVILSKRPEILRFGQELLLVRFQEVSNIAGYAPMYPLEYYQNLITVVYYGILKNLATLSIFLFGSFVVLRIRDIDKKKLGTLILLIIVLDLFVFGMKNVQVADPAEVFEKTPEIAYLEQDPGYHRYALMYDIWDMFGLHQHKAVRYGMYKLGGYDPMMLGRYDRYLESTVKIPDDEENLLYRVQNENLLDLSGTKYLLITEEIDGYLLKFDGRDQGGTVLVYENQDALPRAFVVPNAVLGDGEQVFNKMLSPEFNPRETLYLEDNIGTLNNPGTFTEAKITYYSPNIVKVSANMDNPGFLVLTDNWYPGWKAYDAKGNELEIARADYVFRAVYLPAGNNIVIFEFQPRLNSIGKVITLISLFLVILYLIFRRQKLFNLGK